MRVLVVGGARALIRIFGGQPPEPVLLAKQRRLTTSAPLPSRGGAGGRPAPADPACVVATDDMVDDVARTDTVRSRGARAVRWARKRGLPGEVLSQ